MVYLASDIVEPVHPQRDLSLLTGANGLPPAADSVKQALTASGGWGAQEAVVGVRRVYPRQARGLPAIAGPRGRRGSGVKGGPQGRRAASEAPLDLRGAADLAAAIEGDSGGACHDRG